MLDTDVSRFYNYSVLVKAVYRTATKRSGVNLESWSWIQMNSAYVRVWPRTTRPGLVESLRVTVISGKFRTVDAGSQLSLRSYYDAWLIR